MRQKNGNYRPVSLTLVIGEIFESIIKYVVSEYFEAHDKIWFCEREILDDKPVGIL